MKKISKIFMIGLCAMLTLASCSKEEPDAPLNPMVEQMNGDYSANNESKQFSLTYNGEPMPGKTAHIVSQDGKTITITLKGESLLGPDAPVALPTFGVIAGEKETVLTAEIVEAADAKSFSFKGEDKNSLREVSFEGTINDKQLSLDLKASFNNSLAGTTWNLAPWISDGYTVESQPIHINFETEGKIYLWAGAEYTPNEIFTLVGSVVPLFDGKTLQEVFCNVLKSVTFTKDGNITAEYSTAENIGAPQWVKSASNMVMYSVNGTSLLLEPNLQNILEATSTKAGEEPSLNTDMLIGSLMKALPLISNGLPLTIIEKEGAMTLILDVKVTKVLNEALVAFMKDETNHAIIVKTVTDLVTEKGLNLLLNDIPKTIDTAIASLENTSKVELGINLIKAN